MAGNGRELPVGAADNPITNAQSAPGNDAWSEERYQFWGPSGGRAENVQPAAAANEKLQYADPQMMTLSGQDQQKILALWAQSNGADLNDQNAYAKLAQAPDGKGIAVGPFKLDAPTIANDWLDGMVNSQGLVDHGAIDNYVQQGRLSEQTAAMMATPQFMDFMKSLAAGKQPTPDQIAQFLPPELQQLIASDLANAGAAIVGMNGGALDTQSVLQTVQGFAGQAGPMNQFAQAPGPGPGDYNPDPQNLANAMSEFIPDDSVQPYASSYDDSAPVTPAIDQGLTDDTMTGY